MRPRRARRLGRAGSPLYPQRSAIGLGLTGRTVGRGSRLTLALIVDSEPYNGIEEFARANACDLRHGNLFGTITSGAAGRPLTQGGFEIPPSTPTGDTRHRKRTDYPGDRDELR